MKNPYPNTLDNKRYQTWNYYLKKRFNNKVYKVPLSLGVTCPNRDGTKGTGGCTYCLSGGGGTPYIKGTLREQFEKSAAPLESKWPNSYAMPYFQSYTNTYVKPEILREALNEALNLPKTVGICIATRPDCLPEGIIEVLHEFSRKTFLIVEMGLQTIHEETGELINRGHNYDEFLEGYSKLAVLGIPVCVHLINGLPNENKNKMIETAKEVATLNPHSVKFHMLHILKGTKLAEEYSETPFPLLSLEEYVDIVCDQIELLPAETVIQRVTGDPPQDDLIAPSWTLNKLVVRNEIDKELARRNSYQGKNFRNQKAAK